MGAAPMEAASFQGKPSSSPFFPDEVELVFLPIAAAVVGLLIGPVVVGVETIARQPKPPVPFDSDCRKRSPPVRRLPRRALYSRKVCRARGLHQAEKSSDQSIRADGPPGQTAVWGPGKRLAQTGNGIYLLMSLSAALAIALFAVEGLGG